MPEIARLNCYLQPETKSKLKMYALTHEVSISKLVDDIINDWIDNFDSEEYPKGGSNK